MSRGRLIASGLLGFALLAVDVPTAAAADSISSGVWAGSTLSPSEPCGQSLCGVFERDDGLLGPYDLTVDITIAEVTANPCNTPSSATREGTGTVAFGLSFECNGTYEVSAIATASDLGGRSATIDKTFSVLAPPPPVQGVTWTAGDGRSIVVGWTAAGQPPDVSGYRVERQAGSGWTELAALGGTATEFVDTDPPAAGGTTVYRVQAERNGLRSSGGETTATVTPVPTTTTPPGSPGTPGAPGGVPGAPGGTPVVPGTSGRPLSVQVPRVGTPSRNFFPPLLAPPVDGGAFSETLPFEDREPGEEDAVLPDDLASGTIETAPGRGLVIPLATGMVLAVWAIHLRYLARAAKPEYLDDRDLPELAQW